jgi:hypothetical protein
MVPTRKLGNDDVAAVGFGLMEFSGATYTFVNPNEEEENRLKVSKMKLSSKLVLMSFEVP